MLIWSNMPVVRGLQLAATASASSEGEACIPAALHTHEEPRSHAACSQRPGCRHEPGPTSLILFSLPNSATAPFPIDPSVCTGVGGVCKAYGSFDCTSAGDPRVSPVKAGATMAA